MGSSLPSRLVTVTGGAALLCLGTGCAWISLVATDSVAESAAVERRCAPAAPVPDSRYIRQHAPDSESPLAQVPPALGHRFSREALLIAETIGVSDLITQLPSLEAEAEQQIERSVVRLLQVRQELSDRLLLAFFDVARTAAEADCEEERADQLADRLQETRDRRVRTQTLIAIIGDALVGVLSGGLSLAGHETAAAAGAISGGVLATAFGTSALFSGVQHDFRHPRNLLREVWEAPDEPTLIPRSVWRFLNRPLTDDPEGRSLRETLISRWRQHGRLGEPGSDTEQRRIALFFGEGGLYEIEELRARAAMLDLLEADVNLMSQDLERLLQEILASRAP